ncbi:peptidylprolyl isomerase [Anaerocolumna xylanovorans]|uniref:SurA N-terminal domain-containing protein n=1 Tax=Anaerocolumna xylanovorans DSM 12503 TaxID=1121345 RepID=A0A1M7XXU1_9FIRM|nr:peptidylprolyl isomerase [Anaerocolumna xylanovorans]SHO43789.1 SurA N-terminal domain-containing protein [Anaerocolumna xylanovorans DSM 12503]
MKRSKNLSIVKKHYLFNKGKRLFLILLVIVAALLSLFITCRMASGKNDFSIVAKVNGENIYLREYKQRLYGVRANVYDYFNKKYNANDSKSFWNKSYGGEVPIEAARKKALDECIQIKVQQILLKDKGIQEDISYKTFLKGLDEENKARKEAVKNQRVIFGPLQFGEKEYFEYQFSQMIIGLKEKMGEDDFKIDDNDEKALYDQIKNEDFKNPDSVKVERIIIPYAQMNGVVDESKKQDAKLRIDKIKQMLDSGENFEKLAKLNNPDNSLETKIFDSSTAKTDELTPKLLECAGKLAVGEISNVFDENNIYSIIKCVEHKNMGVKSFGEVKEAIRQMLIEKAYNEYINKLVKNAKVEVNQEIYSHIFID